MSDETEPSIETLYHDLLAEVSSTEQGGQLAAQLTTLYNRWQAQLNSVYSDRNLVAQLAAVLAQHLGYPSGQGIDKDEPEWPPVYIDLPSGQVSWHIPQGEWVALLGPYERAWDEHSSDEKQRRIRAFLEQSVDQV